VAQLVSAAIAISVLVLIINRRLWRNKTIETKTGKRKKG